MLPNHSYKILDFTSVENTKPASLTEWTYSYLKERILNLDLKPGEQIHIKEYAEKLEISRTPIREAFLRLMADGLVVVRPRVGYFISDITEQDIRELFEIRELIETRATRKAVDLLTDEDLEQMQKILDESQKAVEAGDLNVFIRNDVKFHGFLEKHVQNSHMKAFFDSIIDLTHRERIMSIKILDNVNQSITEHIRILDGLKQRDANLAERFMEEHLSNVSERLIKYVREKNKENKEN